MIGNVQSSTLLAFAGVWWMNFALAGMAVLALAAVAFGAEAGKGSDVQASLVADVTAVKPGMPFTLGVVLTTQRQWHIYWKNPGDAGAATAFTFQMPEGYKVEPVQFPLPVRFTDAGDITSYGYTGRTVFLARVTPPAKIEEGQKAKLAVEVSWLSCRDVCVPGGATLSLELPAGGGAGAAAGDHGELFARARGLMPEGAPPKEVVERVEVLNNEGGGTGLQIEWKKQPKGEVEVFPLTPEGVEVSDIRVNNEGAKTRILLKWRQLAGTTKVPGPLPLLVTYRDDKGERHGFYSSIDFAPLAMPK